MGCKHRPVAHAKLRPRLSENFTSPRQHFPLQKHHGNFHLFSRIRDTAHHTKLLHSKKPITKFSRVALELIWCIYLHVGSPYCFRTRGWLLGLMGWSLRHLKLGMPSRNHFLNQSLDGRVHVCNCGGHLLEQALVRQTLYVHCHCCKYIQFSYAANKLEAALQTQLPKPMKGLSLLLNLS